ncbi:HD-hydrolase domain [Dissulfuribacter thermophilus]|uniref:HD-hydrolase domain n=1 Tax=Dissulfuribacter thermophilus TaxID=1156395 RepID=A0A1B9F5S5_9BACT|nr:HD domain-containing phosphohydrolase [Dissulfuribacter thermophilus]OCC15297.1 HD-hydrolase domain [Dissulfuribacter thermophilus]
MLGTQTDKKMNAVLPSLSRFSVLVVEDDPLQRELLSNLLRSWGLHVFEADSGESAFEFLQNTKEKVRLLITDLQMPRMDGLALLKKIRRERPYRFYSIAISGLGDRESIQKALKAGASDFLKKPFLPEQLFARLAVLDRIVALEEDYYALVKGLFDVMTEMLGSRDSYTLEHSLRVAALSKRVGMRMGIADEELEALELGCLVHDVGKIAIPDDILLKPGPFDTLDRKIMNLHPNIGASFLEKRYPDLRVSEIALQHHERLDGSGYPHGLMGKEINPLVLIVSPCDVYEALVAQRPYKRPMDKESALDIIDEEVRKGRFSKDVVANLKEVLKEWDPLAIKKNNSKELDLIESFRKKTYFREPLCSFYNYRYILSLEKEQLLDATDKYKLILIDFENIGEFNRRIGYLKTDEILDEIGEKLQEILNTLHEWNRPSEKNALLFRKGPDFLVFTSYPKEVNEKIEQQIFDVLKVAERDWGLKANMKSKEFTGSQSFSKALDIMVGI